MLERRQGLLTDIEEIERRIRAVPISDDALADALRRAPPGLVLEFGVYRGESLNYIASLVPDRVVYGFDSFEGLPETWRIGTEERGCFKTKPPTDLRGNARLVVGLFQNTLNSFLEAANHNVAFVHIDCDLYSSTKFVLDAVTPWLAPRAIIAFDEMIGYRGCEDHELKAFKEFLEDTGFEYRVIGRRHGCSAIVRIEHV